MAGQNCLSARCASAMRLSTNMGQGIQRQGPAHNAGMIMETPVSLRTSSGPHTMNSSSTCMEFPTGFADTAKKEFKPTKTQKRDRKRTECKKNMADHEKGSVSSGDGNRNHLQYKNDGANSSILRELWIECIVAWKTTTHFKQLVRFGFDSMKSLQALQKYGSNMEKAIAWLLNGCGASEGGEAESRSTDSIGRFDQSGDLAAEIDLSYELKLLAGVQEAFGVPNEVMEQAVVDCSGDVNAAVSRVLENCGASSSARSLYHSFDVQSSAYHGADGPVDHMWDGVPDSPFGYLEHKAYAVPQDHAGHSTADTFLDDQMMGCTLGSKFDVCKSHDADVTMLTSEVMELLPQEVGSGDLDLVRLSQRRGTHIPLVQTPDNRTSGMYSHLKGNLNVGIVDIAQPDSDSISNLVSDIAQYNRQIRDQSVSPRDPFTQPLSRYGSNPAPARFSMTKELTGTSWACTWDGFAVQRDQTNFVTKRTTHRPNAAWRPSDAVTADTEMAEELELSHMIGSLMCR